MLGAQKQSTKAPFAGHPAYDQETRDYISTPRPGLRVKPEAQENANRNRGSLNLSWESSDLSDSRTSGMDSSSGRYCSSEGRENLIRSRGTLANIIQRTGSTPREPVCCRATTTQGAGIAEQSKGGRMNLLFTNYGKNEVTPRQPPRVKWEASGNYDMNRGSVMNKLMHDGNSMPVTDRPGPRVKPEAEMIAMKNRGSMNGIMRVCTPRY